MRKKSRILLAIVIVVIIFLIILILGSLFGTNSSHRCTESENYKISMKEKNKVEEIFKEVENFSDVEIKTNCKILKIFLYLSDDTDFNSINKLTTDVISSFSSENLEYYDIELFIESKNKESEIYPKIGYKNKTSDKFVW